MTEKSADQEFVEYIIKAIVDHPEGVKTERKIDEMGVLISLEVHPEDMGQVIGRQGQTAKSLRTLLRVIGAKNNARVNLKIVEPEGSTRPPRRMPHAQDLMSSDHSQDSGAPDTSMVDGVDDLKI